MKIEETKTKLAEWEGLLGLARRTGQEGMEHLAELKVAKLKENLKRAIDEFDAAMKDAGLCANDPRVCGCGCYESNHEDGGGRCLTNYRGCRCRQFDPLKPPAVNPFTTAEHYRGDRKGYWTGD